MRINSIQITAKRNTFRLSLRPRFSRRYGSLRGRAICLRRRRFSRRGSCRSGGGLLTKLLITGFEWLLERDNFTSVVAEVYFEIAESKELFLMVFLLLARYSLIRLTCKGEYFLWSCLRFCFSNRSTLLEFLSEFSLKAADVFWHLRRDLVMVWMKIVC